MPSSRCVSDQKIWDDRHPRFMLTSVISQICPGSANLLENIVKKIHINYKIYSKISIFYTKGVNYNEEKYSK